MTGRYIICARLDVSLKTKRSSERDDRVNQIKTYIHTKNNPKFLYWNRRTIYHRFGICFQADNLICSHRLQNDVQNVMCLVERRHNIGFGFLVVTKRIRREKTKCSYDIIAPLFRSLLSFQTTTTVCGLYIHFSKSSFGPNGPLKLERSLLYICVTAIFHNTIYILVRYFFLFIRLMM